MIFIFINCKNLKNMKNFFKKICCCLCKKSDSIPLVEVGEENLEMGIKKLSHNASEEELFDKRWYREDEKEKIKYVTRQIFKFKLHRQRKV